MKLIKQNGKAILTENLYKKLIQELANIKLKKKINESVILKLLVEVGDGEGVPKKTKKTKGEGDVGFETVTVAPGTEDAEGSGEIGKTIQKLTGDKKLAGLYAMMAYDGTLTYLGGLTKFKDLLRKSEGIFNVATFLKNNLYEFAGAAGANDTEVIDAVATILAFIAADKTAEKFWVKMLAAIIQEDYQSWEEFTATFLGELVLESAIVTAATGTPIPAIGRKLAVATIETSLEKTGKKFFKETYEEMASQARRRGLQRPGEKADLLASRLGNLTKDIPFPKVRRTKYNPLDNAEIRGDIIADTLTKIKPTDTAKDIAEKMLKASKDQLNKLAEKEAKKGENLIDMEKLNKIKNLIRHVETPAGKKAMLRHFQKSAKTLQDAQGNILRKLDIDKPAFAMIQRKGSLFKNSLSNFVNRWWNSDDVLRFEQALLNNRMGGPDALKIKFNFIFKSQVPAAIETKLKTGMRVTDTSVLSEEFVNDGLEELVRLGIKEKDSFAGMAIAMIKDATGPNFMSNRSVRDLLKDTFSKLFLFNGGPPGSFKKYATTAGMYLVGGKAIPRSIIEFNYQQGNIPGLGDPSGVTQDEKNKKALQISIMMDPKNAKDYIKEYTTSGPLTTSKIGDPDAVDRIRSVAKEKIIRREAEAIELAVKDAYEQSGVSFESLAGVKNLNLSNIEMPDGGYTEDKPTVIPSLLGLGPLGSKFSFAAKVVPRLITLIPKAFKSTYHAIVNPVYFLERLLKLEWPFANKNERIWENFRDNQLEDLSDMFKEVRFSSMADSLGYINIKENGLDYLALNNILDIGADAIMSATNSNKVPTKENSTGSVSLINPETDLGPVAQKIGQKIGTEKGLKFMAILLKRYQGLESEFGIDFNELNKSYIDAIKDLTGARTTNTNENKNLNNKLLLTESDMRKFVAGIIKKKDLLNEGDVVITEDQAATLTSYFMRSGNHVSLGKSIKFEQFENLHKIKKLKMGENPSLLQNFPNCLFSLDDTDKSAENYFVFVLFLKINTKKFKATAFPKKADYVYDITNKVDNQVYFNKNLIGKDLSGGLTYDNIITSLFRQLDLRSDTDSTTGEPDKAAQLGVHIDDLNNVLVDARSQMITNIREIISEKSSDSEFQVPILVLGYDKTIKDLIKSNKNPDRKKLLKALTAAGANSTNIVTKNNTAHRLVLTDIKSNPGRLATILLDQNSSIVNQMSEVNKLIVTDNPKENQLDEVEVEKQVKREKRKQRLSTETQDESPDAPQNLNIKFLQDSGVMSRDNPPKWLGKDGFNSNVTLTSQKSKANMTLWAQIYTLFCLHKFVELGTIAQSDVLKLELYKKGWTKYTGSGGALDFKFTQVEMNLAFKLVTKSAKEQKLGPYANNSMPVFKGEPLVDFYSKIKNKVPAYVGYHGSQTFAGVAAIARDIFLENEPGTSGSDAKTNFIVRENKINMSQNKLRETIKKILKSKS